MNQSSNISSLLIVLVLVFTLYACGTPGVNDPGQEYMPDMGHSIRL